MGRKIKVDCQAIDNVQLDGPLEDKSFSVQEGSIGRMYLYRFTFEPPVVKLRLTGEKDGIIEMRADGVLYLNGSLDWETKKVHRLQVEGLDVNGQRVKGPYSIIINVKDINDNPPEFDQKKYYGVVRQNSRAGKPFMYVKASDRDDPTTPNGQLSYKIRQHFPNPFPEMLFQIDNVTGAISTSEAGALHLNPADVSSFLLDVEAHDMAGQSVNAFSCSTAVEVTVLENLWKSPPPVKIKENSTEPHPISITQVQWNYPGAKYEISSKERPPMKLPFMIDQNGTIYVTEPLDREEKDSYSFYAFAKDEDGDILLARPVTVTVTVEDINDNPPVCDKALTIFEVQENEGSGNLIGIVHASDADQKGMVSSRLQYRIVDQNPKIPADKMFLIDSGTGTINLLQNALRKQMVSNYSLKVEVTDPGSLPVPCSPKCLCCEYGYITLPENKPVGTVIMEIQATDGDEPFTGSSQILYTIKKGDPNNTFSIRTDPKTNRGYVTINKVLDFETTPAYNLLISATNPEPLVAGIQYNSSSNAYLRVNVTDVDEAPVFFQPTFIVDRYENVSVGTFVTTAMAYDPEGARISPVILFCALFTPIAKASQSSTAQLILNVKDVNDNPPKLAKDFLFFCHPLKGNEKAKIEVTDPDEFSYIPKFTYVLLGLHAYISPKNINLEEKSYNIPIQINDNGRPPMQGVVYLQVKVCRCVEERCFLEIDPPSSLPTVAMAVGILVAVLVVIGVILGIVFLRLKRKKQDQQKATRANAASPSELQNLT
ncbi:hypothetical protein JD844_015956 [Phrynosoma platyrhinos]|uniref:Cadherin domain-containing protein n=1 Tax=Phrynosoma platyrhinos TaxID=52577 RepID=A0ABQ7SJP3_PHRPL|nr:hypothetical protein JD844_015956 [Phrynosoma platyrhinos]